MNNAHTLQSLDWDLIFNWLKSFIVTPVGIKEISNYKFVNSYQNVNLLYDILDQYSSLYKIYGRPPLVNFPEILPVLTFIDNGSIVDKEDFLLLKEYLSALADMKSYFAKIDFNSYPLLLKFNDFISFKREIARKTEATFTGEGDIKESATPELQRLSTMFQSKQLRARESSNTLLASKKFKKSIQDSYYTIRDGRYVLPVKKDFVGNVKGIVHGLSSTGQTAYFEPEELFSVNNELQSLKDEIKIEKIKILRELQKEISENIGVLLNLYNLMGELDFLNAKYQFSKNINGIRPELLKKSKRIELFNAKNPILIKKNSKVIGNDIYINQSKSALIISGPNAGGKTVFLKTTGLIFFLIYSGIYIPVDKGSKTYIPENVFAEIGDYQSIGEDNSTFSSHIEKCNYIYENISDGSLVLIDEIMLGTDQEEGSFLAQSLMEHYLEKGAMVIVTTHYTNIKILPYINKSFRNAKVEIDPYTFNPLYKMKYDEIGTSYPLAIAKLFKMEKKVILRAEEIKKESQSETGKAISQIAELSNKLQKKVRKLDEKIRDIENRKKILEEEYKIKKEDIKKKLSKEKDKIKKIIEERNSEIDELIKEFKEKQKTHLLANAKKIVKDFKFNEGVDKNKGEKLYQGDWVQHLALGFVGIVKDIRKSKVIINSEGREIIGRKEEFVKIKSPTDDKNQKFVFMTNQSNEINNRIDIRGKTSDIALAELEKVINSLVVDNFSGNIIIIHGHGTGVLKKTVREYLNNHPLVDSFRSGQIGEGGDGVTVVKI